MKTSVRWHSERSTDDRVEPRNIYICDTPRASSASSRTTRIDIVLIVGKSIMLLLIPHWSIYYCYKRNMHYLVYNFSFKSVHNYR